MVISVSVSPGSAAVACPADRPSAAASPSSVCFVAFCHFMASSLEPIVARQFFLAGRLHAGRGSSDRHDIPFRPSSIWQQPITDVILRRQCRGGRARSRQPVTECRKIPLCRQGARTSVAHLTFLSVLLRVPHR